MTVSILIATHGDPKWSDLARRRALPTASNQNAHEVIVRHATDLNLAESRNELAVKATGDWLCFLDSDDELGPGYIDAMRRAMLDQRPWSLLVPFVQYVDILREVEIGGVAETGFITKSEPPRSLNTGRPLYQMNWAVIGTLVPRELFLAVGGFRGDLTIYEDWELWLRCERAGAELIEVPGAIYRAYRRKGSRNERSPEAVKTYQQIRRAFERRSV